MTKRRTKGLAGLDSVASSNSNNNDNSNNSSKGNKVSSNDSNNGNSKDSNNEDNEGKTSIEDIISKVTNKPPVTRKRQIAVYINEDIAKAFDKYSRKNGKGAKSELIEELLRSALSNAGYM